MNEIAELIKLRPMVSELQAKLASAQRRVRDLEGELASKEDRVLALNKEIVDLRAVIKALRDDDDHRTPHHGTKETDALVPKGKAKSKTKTAAVPKRWMKRE